MVACETAGAVFVQAPGRAPGDVGATTPRRRTGAPSTLSLSHIGTVGGPVTQAEPERSCMLLGEHVTDSHAKAVLAQRLATRRTRELPCQP